MRQQQSTTMSYQSVTFGSNGEIVNTDLESHVRPANAMGDAAKSRVGITVNTPQFARFNTGSDAPATQGSSTLRVQLHQPTNRVAALGTTVEPEVLENLKKMAPEAFEEPSEKAQAAAKVDAEAKAEETSREELNRHPREIEGYHQ